MFKNKNKNKNKNSKGFEITQERIDTINTATYFIKTIGDFAKWADDNFYGTNVEQTYYIFEDFVKSNKHIIQKINKVMPPSIFP